jgi:putative polyhydroxyalkanoate system protein
MSEIRFVRPHALSIAKAKALLQKTVDGLAEEYNLSSEWRGDTLHFQRSGIHGQAHVTDVEIGLHITIGFLLMPFKTSIADNIERSFDKLLPLPGPGAHAGTSRKTAHKNVKTGSGH